MFLLFLCVSCDTQNTETDVDLPVLQGEPLVLRSGGEGLPDSATDFYGIHCIEHASGTPVAWNSPAVTLFNTEMKNLMGHISGSHLVFDPAGDYRYPINDSLSVFVYYPYVANTEPHSLAVARQEKFEGATKTADKYPDYIAGTKTLSVIGGIPEDPNQATVPLRHLMARVRFQISNSGADAIMLTRVRLTGIKWDGTINPIQNRSFFVPDGAAIPESLVLYEGFRVEGLETEPQRIPVNPIYNYSDTEASASSYDKDYKYHILVPPLNETLLAGAKLEIEFNRYGNNYTITVEMRQIKINEWLSGNSYCYTIAFNTYSIDYIDTIIEPWKEDIYTGAIDLQ